MNWVELCVKLSKLMHEYEADWPGVSAALAAVGMAVAADKTVELAEYPEDWVEKYGPEEVNMEREIRGEPWFLDGLDTSGIEPGETIYMKAGKATDTGWIPDRRNGGFTRTTTGCTARGFRDD